MTTARFSTTGGCIHTVEISGHAGYADEGSDIVCAAISSALDLTSCLLEDVLGLPIHTEIDEASGRILLSLPQQMEDGDALQAQNAMSALMVYLINLGVRYPDFIEVMEV
mgnify:CR=1 FL=1